MAIVVWARGGVVCRPAIATTRPDDRFSSTLRTGRLHVFGDNPHDRILDALMASTALTPMHPPWEVDGEYYIDGGTVTPLPLRVALERGATEIYSLHIQAGAGSATEVVACDARRLTHGVADLLAPFSPMAPSVSAVGAGCAASTRITETIRKGRHRY